MKSTQHETIKLNQQRSQVLNWNQQWQNLAYLFPVQGANILGVPQTAPVLAATPCPGLSESYALEWTVPIAPPGLAELNEEEYEYPVEWQYGSPTRILDPRAAAEAIKTPKKQIIKQFFIEVFLLEEFDTNFAKLNIFYCRELARSFYTLKIYFPESFQRRGGFVA